MKKAERNNISLLSVLTILLLTILLLIIGHISIVAAENVQNNTTEQQIAVQPTIQVTEGKFRVGPTVRIRPLNDVINKSADGIIEMFFDNPSTNDVSLSAEIRITVPSGIHVYGQGFGEAVAAGMLYAKMDVPPGTVRTAYINIKSEKTGNFYAQLSGTYYPGENKDKYQPLSFTYPFSVKEPSPDPKVADLTNPTQVPSGGNWWSDKIIPGVIIAVIAGLIGLGYKIVEIKYLHKLTESKTAKSKVTEKDGRITEQETTETKVTENK